MNLYAESLWMSALDETLAILPTLDVLAGKTLMITGVNGLICSAIADLLIRWNERHSGKIRILFAARNRQRVEERFAPYCRESWFLFVPYDSASGDNQLTIPCDYIIHGASNAYPGIVSKEPVETMLSNFLGVRGLLDYAARVGVKRLLYISSSEVYGQKSDGRPFSESDYGYVDLLNPRNAYPVGKRAAETMCASYAAEYGIESVIVRPGHIYGPTASRRDNRVSSQWAYAVAGGKDIVMKSDGTQKRSYCHCLDCASGILTVLLHGEGGQAYNISNPDSIITIRQMAQILADAAGVCLKMELPTESERRSFNPMPNSSLDSSKLEALGWKGLFDAQRGFEETVDILKAQMN